METSRPAASGTWALEVFYDGECPRCRRETAWLRWLDRRGRIGFTDLAAPGLSPDALDVNHDQLMAEIHGRFPDGRMVRGVEVFRQLYAAAGFGPLVAMTRIPGVRHVLEVGYGLFARNRLKLTGRCTDACRIGGPQ